MTPLDRAYADMLARMVAYTFNVQTKRKDLRK